jgi:hypothetical protein
MVFWEMTIDELRCLASQKGVSPYYDENSGLQRQQRTEGRCRVQRSVKRAKPHDGAESLGQGPLLAFPSLALQCACCLCIRVSAHGTAEALGCCCVVSAVERATFDVVLGHMAGPMPLAGALLCARQSTCDVLL